MKNWEHRCIFGCRTDGVYIHRFPHPYKKPVLYKTWLAIVGDYLKEKDPIKVYKNKRVCNHHFKLADKTSGHRLVASACPTINLGEVQESINTIVDKEHNYSFARQASNVPILDENILGDVPVDTPTITNTEFEKPVFDNEVAPVSDALNNIHLDTILTTEETDIIYEVPTNGYEIIRECDMSYYGSDDFLILPAADVPLAATELRKSSEASTNDTISGFNSDTNVMTNESAVTYQESSNGYELNTVCNKSYESIEEFLVMNPRTDASHPETNERNNGFSDNNGEEISVDSDNLYKVFEDYLIIPPACDALFPSTDQDGNNEPNDCVDTITESDKLYEEIEEFLVIPSKPKISVPTTEITEERDQNKTAPQVLSENVCDTCRNEIVGIGYRCLQCDGYNHCQNCEIDEAHPNHYMIRMPSSLRSEVFEYIIAQMYNEFRPNSSKQIEFQESGLAHSESVNNNPKLCESEVDLSEDVKSLIRNEVARVVDNKDVDKRKRKETMPDDTSRKKKMAVQTATMNDELSMLSIEQSDNFPLYNGNNSTDNEKEINNISLSTNDTVLIDDTRPDAAHMSLNTDISQLILVTTKEGKKLLYKCVDS